MPTTSHLLQSPSHKLSNMPSSVIDLTQDDEGLYDSRHVSTVIMSSGTMKTELDHSNQAQSGTTYHDLDDFKVTASLRNPDLKQEFCMLLYHTMP
jgi:hypothetical protein